MATRPARPKETVRLDAPEAALFWVLAELPELELPELVPVPTFVPVPTLVEAAPLLTLVMVLPAEAEADAALTMLEVDGETVEAAAELTWDCDTANSPWLIDLAVEHWLLEGAG